LPKLLWGRDPTGIFGWLVWGGYLWYRRPFAGGKNFFCGIVYKIDCNY